MAKRKRRMTRDETEAQIRKHEAEAAVCESMGLHVTAQIERERANDLREALRRI